MQHLWEGLSGEVASEQRLTGERNPEDPGGGASSKRRRVSESESGASVLCFTCSSKR